MLKSKHHGDTQPRGFRPCGLPHDVTFLPPFLQINQKRLTAEFQLVPGRHPHRLLSEDSGWGAGRGRPGSATGRLTWDGWRGSLSLRTQAARLGQGSLSVEIITGWGCGLLWAPLPTLSPGRPPGPQVMGGSRGSGGAGSTGRPSLRPGHPLPALLCCQPDKDGVCPGRGGEGMADITEHPPGPRFYHRLIECPNDPLKWLIYRVLSGQMTEPGGSESFRACPRPSSQRAWNMDTVSAQECWLPWEEPRCYLSSETRGLTGLTGLTTSLLDPQGRRSGAS